MQSRQTAPRLFCQWLIVDPRIRKAAAVRNAIGPHMQYPCVPTFRFFATAACWSNQVLNAFASVIGVASFKPWDSGITRWIGVAPPASAVGTFLHASA